MLDATKHITDDNFFFQEDSAQVHCPCNTVQLSEKCDFRVSPFCQVVQKHKLFEVPTLSVVKNIKIHSCVSTL